MLHCTMTPTSQLLLSLEDVVAELHCARRAGDLGRITVLSYSDLKRWARMARNETLAQRSWEFILKCPHRSRDEFLSEADSLIQEAETALQSMRRVVQH